MVRLAIVLGMLLLPALAAGEELELELGASVEYDNNVFRTENNTEDDWIFRVYPGVALYRDRGDFRYRLRYVIPFEQGVRFGDAISDFDHVLNFNSSWILNEANELYANNLFRYDRSITRRFAEDQSAPDLNDRRFRVLTNRTDVGLNHAFSPRTTGGLNFSYDIFNTEQQTRQDNQSFGATTDLNYALNAKNQVGTGFSFSLQDFESAGGIPASQNFFYNLFGSWVYQFDETTTLTLAAGPVVIQSQQDSTPGSGFASTNPFVTSNGLTRGFLFTPACNLVDTKRVLNGCPFAPLGVSLNTAQVPVTFAPDPPPSSASDVTVTVFGNFNLTRRWTPSVSSALAYRRQQNNASGLGGSVIIDALTLRGDWQIDQWWDFQARFDFTHRESIATQSQSFQIVQAGNLVDTNGDGIPDTPLAESVPFPAQGLTAEPVRNAIDTNRWGISGRLARQIGRRAEASLRLVYNQQTSKRGTRGNPSDFDDFLAIFGVRYRFEPITLW